MKILIKINIRGKDVRGSRTRSARNSFERKKWNFVLPVMYDFDIQRSRFYKQGNNMVKSPQYGGTHQ
jgi:hypothetical protein